MPDEMPQPKSADPVYRVRADIITCFEFHVQAPHKTKATELARQVLDEKKVGPVSQTPVRIRSVDCVDKNPQPVPATSK